MLKHPPKKVILILHDTLHFPEAAPDTLNNTRVPSFFGHISSLAADAPNDIALTFIQQVCDSELFGCLDYELCYRNYRAAHQVFLGKWRTRGRANELVLRKTKQLAFQLLIASLDPELFKDSAGMNHGEAISA